MKGAPDALRRLAPPALMVASGFAGLGYQIVWTEQCSSFLGHESAAVLAVIAAFFGGLAVGGLLLGRRVEESARPLYWYAACELVVGLWSLFLLGIGAPFGALMARTIGVDPGAGWQWTVAFIGTFVLLLPATAAMGATLPAMERLTSETRRHRRSIAALYAANTLGAVLGVLAAAFLLLPTVGLARTATVSVALNLACAVIALAAFPRTSGPRPSSERDRTRARSVLLRLAATGLLGIGYEVLVVRVLSQVTEDTVYTFALLLAVYLVGTAAGAAAYRRFLERRRDRELEDALFTALAAACLMGGALLWASQSVKEWALDAFGSSMGAALGGEALLALGAFGLPTFAMGALFSHLSRAANAAGVSFGRALGVNTLAAAVAPLVFGVLAAPLLGAKLTLVLIAASYLGLTAPRAWLTKLVLVPASLTAAVALFAPELRFVDVPAGGRVVSYAEGVAASVSVVEDEARVLRLRIDNRQQEGSSATPYVDARQAWLPLLLHAAPRRALFLGLGSGVTATSAAEDPTLEVTAVELLPEVIEAAKLFSERLETGPARARLHLLSADARRFVRASDGSYDVIVSDNFHPARSGSGALYTVEHFEAVRRRLAPGGLFCQWLPLHQLDLETLRSIVRSFVIVNPGAFALLANNGLDTPVIGLVARADQRRFDARAIRERRSRAALPERMNRLGFEDELAVFGSFIAGPKALERFAGSAPANTDDHPVVAYRAPRVTYAPDSRPRDRLFALLARVSLSPTELVLPSDDPAWPERLSAYFLARNRFIESGRDVRATARVEEMLAQVEGPLLSVLRISPDFRPAYDPLLSMASALARSNVSGARTLLAELRRIQPARNEASELLTMIGDEAHTIDARSQ